MEVSQYRISLLKTRLRMVVSKNDWAVGHFALGIYNYTVKAFVVTPHEMCKILVINVFEIIFIT